MKRGQVVYVLWNDKVWETIVENPQYFTMGYGVCVKVKKFPGGPPSGLLIFEPGMCFVDRNEALLALLTR